MVVIILSDVRRLNTKESQLLNKGQAFLSQSAFNQPLINMNTAGLIINSKSRYIKCHPAISVSA